MKANIILLDTCSFYRLCSFFTDLLNITVKINGDDFIIKLHEDIESEYKRAKSLVSKYSEINLPSIKKNNKFKCPKTLINSFTDEYLLIEYTSDMLDLMPPPSPVDMRCLTLEYISNEKIITVTDDKNMSLLAKYLKIEIISSIHLLYYLYRDNKITIEDISMFKQHLHSINDWIYFFNYEVKKYFSNLAI